MLSDPQSVTIGTTPVSLPRVSVGDRKATYESADGSKTLNISHVNGKRSRSVVRLDDSKMASDPANPSINKQVGASVYTVVDAPPTGYTDAELTDLVKANTTLINSTGFLAKFLGQES